jgi:hypothetical protein
VIAFVDGDKTNCAIENLECVSRVELARRNSVWARYAARAGGSDPAERRAEKPVEESGAHEESECRICAITCSPTLEALKRRPTRRWTWSGRRRSADVAQTIINSAKVEVDLAKAIGAESVGSEFFGGVPERPRLLAEAVRR